MAVDADKWQIRADLCGGKQQQCVAIVRDHGPPIGEIGLCHAPEWAQERDWSVQGQVALEGEGMQHIIGDGADDAAAATVIRSVLEGGDHNASVVGGDGASDHRRRRACRSARMGEQSYAEQCGPSMGRAERCHTTSALVFLDTAQNDSAEGAEWSASPERPMDHLDLSVLLCSVRPDERLRLPRPRADSVC